MFCPNCGKQIDDGSVFCPECGANVGAAAPAAPAAPKIRKPVKKGVVIGVLAGLLAVAAAVVLLIIFTSPKHKLMGTWVYKEDGEEIYRITFDAKGKGTSDELRDFTWKVGKKNTLTITDVDENETEYDYDKGDAKDGDKDCWYVDGKTLYFNGMKLTKTKDKADTGSVAFDLKYSKSDVEKFMRKVCRNIDAKSVKLKRVEKDDYSIDAYMDIAMPGGKAQTVVAGFYADRNEEKVSSVRIYVSDYDKGEYDSARAAILGLEKTLGGGEAEKTLKKRASMKGWGEAGYENYRDVANYWISDTASARIYVGYIDSDEDVSCSYYVTKGDRKEIEALSSKLEGTWKYENSYWDSDTVITFRADGTLTQQITYHYVYSPDSVYDYEGTWSIEGNGTLSLSVDGDSYSREYSEDAMNDSYSYWYIDGNTLYFNGGEYDRQ